MSSLGEMASTRKVRVIHDLTFDLWEDSLRRGRNTQSSGDNLSPCLFAQALPALIREVTALHRRDLERRFLLETDFHSAFPKGSINLLRPVFLDIRLMISLW